MLHLSRHQSRSDAQQPDVLRIVPGPFFPRPEIGEEMPIEAPRAVLLKELARKTDRVLRWFT